MSAGATVMKLSGIASGGLVAMVAFAWGNHLLGPLGSLLFGFLATATLWLVYQTFFIANTWKTFRSIIVIPLAVFVAVGIWNPALFNSDLADIIERQANTRIARREIVQVLASDARFHQLSISTFFHKTTMAIVQGDVADQDDWNRLKKRIKEECPRFKKDYGIIWKVTVGGQQADQES